MAAARACFASSALFFTVLGSEGGLRKPSFFNLPDPCSVNNGGCDAILAGSVCFFGEESVASENHCFCPPGFYEVPGENKCGERRSVWLV